MPHQEQEPRKMMIKLKLNTNALAAAAAAAGGGEGGGSGRSGVAAESSSSSSNSSSKKAQPHTPAPSTKAPSTPGSVKIKFKPIIASQAAAAAATGGTTRATSSPQPLGSSKTPSAKDKDKDSTNNNKSSSKSKASRSTASKPAKITIPAAVVKQLRESGAGTPGVGPSPTTLTLKTPSIKFKTKIDGKPAAFHRKRPVEPGLGYDSEASDREEDPMIEEQFILRMKPGGDCDYLRHLVETRQLETTSDVWMKFKDARRAVVFVRGTLYAATLVDLPCIIESSKTLDKKAIFKTADICQMLIVGDTIPDEDSHLSNPLTHNDVTYPHGLTPPLQYVRKRRFRKRVSNRTIEAVEQEVDRLLAEDQKAISSKYELLDPTDLLMRENEAEAEETQRNTQQTNGVAHRRRDHDGLFGSDEDADADVDAEGEIEYDLEAATSGVPLPRAAATAGGPNLDVDAEGEDEEDADWNELQSAIMGGMTQMMELDAKPQTESDYPGLPPPHSQTAPPAESPSTDEDDDEDEEEEEDDEGNENEDTEAAQEAAQQNQKVKQDIADLEALIARKLSDLNAPNLNPIIRGRIQGIIQNLQAQLEVKRNLLEGGGMVS